MHELSDRLRDAPALRSVAARYAALPTRPTGRLVTRFAPSPTGELHLGHVAHALWVWGVAAVLDAIVFVRMEDHDRTRCRPEYEQSIVNDVAWLGFQPDSESVRSLARAPSEYRQSDQPKRYAEAATMLAAATDVYGCTCTRSMLDAPDRDGERHYPGTCRGQLIERAGTVSVRARLPDDPTRTTDLLLGELVQHPQSEHGDVVIRDASGQWTYQHCVVVDDLLHGVNLVVRGADLTSSTGRQQLLASLLGRAEPVITVHHPLVLAPDGRKLSKRDASETVRSMREAGMGAEDVLERAWRVSGLAERQLDDR